MLKRRKVKMEPEPSEECPLIGCMKIMGGAWTPSILWCLKGRSRRFSELRDDIPGVSAKVLTQRLRRLETDGLVVRTVMPTSPPTVEYTLTDLGEELKPVIEAIVRVGEKMKRRKRQSQK